MNAKIRWQNEDYVIVWISTIFFNFAYFLWIFYRLDRDMKIYTRHGPLLCHKYILQISCINSTCTTYFEYPNFQAISWRIFFFKSNSILFYSYILFSNLSIFSCFFNPMLESWLFTTILELNTSSLKERFARNNFYSFKYWNDDSVF